MLGLLVAVGQGASIARQFVNAQQSATFHPSEQHIRPDHLLCRILLTTGLLPNRLLTLYFLKLMQHLRLGLYRASCLLY